MPSTPDSCAKFVEIEYTQWLFPCFDNRQWLESVDYFHPASSGFALDLAEVALSDEEQTRLTFLNFKITRHT